MSRSSWTSARQLIAEACSVRNCSESELAARLGLSSGALRAFKVRPAPPYVTLALAAVIVGIEPGAVDVHVTP